MDNKIAHALRHAPAEVKRRWVEQFDEDATEAMAVLLKGSSHVCPMCKYDAGPRKGPEGRVYACGCDKPNVQAVRLYCELAGAVGPMQAFILNLSQNYGVANEGELKELVDSGRRMRQLQADATASLNDLIDESVSLLLEAQRIDARAVQVALTRLQGVVPETNGNGAHE